MLKKLLASSLILLLTGCTSLQSKAGAIPNAELYVHRIPNKPVGTVLQTDEKGIVRQVIPWGEISSNAPAIGNSVANIVQAVNGHFGFPFSIIPELVNSSIKGASQLKEETQNQEVYKLNMVQGINTLEATLPDGTTLKVNLNQGTKSVEKKEGDSKSNG